jgi:hypothetical protein
LIAKRLTLLETIGIRMSVPFDTLQFGINCELRATSSGVLFLPKAALLIIYAIEHIRVTNEKCFYSI